MRRTALLLATTGFLLAAVPPAAGADSPSLSPHCVRNVETGNQQCYRDLRLRKGNLILAVLFSDREFSGRSLTLVGSRSCQDNGGPDFRGELTGQWAASVTSVQVWGKCQVNLYEKPGQIGNRDGPFKEDTRYVGPLLDNRARSFTLG